MTAVGTSVAENLAQVKRRVAAACARVGRPAAEVTVLVATKTIAAERIAEAVRCGATLLGENRMQEAVRKCEQVEVLAGSRPQWHFIGHLQSNKIPELLRFASCLQSLDRLSLAEKLDRHLQRDGRALDVLLQVNTSGEASKFGIAPEESLALARAVARLGTLRVQGLMTIGLLGATPEEARPSLRLLRECRDRIEAEGISGVSMAVLSMGMSGDLEVAIEEGATLVRVGQAVFGPRATPDSLYWPDTRKEARGSV